MSNRRRNVVRAIAAVGTLVVVSALADAGGAATLRPAAPQFATVKLKASAGRSEPRLAVGQRGRVYVDTNAAKDGSEVIYRSGAGRTRWLRTPSQPPDQTRPTTDVDIVATPSGRLIASELDLAGINFRTAYSDNGGRTWTESSGTTYADTDRQWLAVGPRDPQTHQYRVYLLFHNLLSGAAQHNMFVATSTDGGQTFGTPVPVSVPGQQDYADLQCADSGGPSNIFTDRKTGRVFVVFGTRSSSSPLSGCTAQPPEINVVAANRVWMVTAPAGKTQTVGGWTPHLAVNDSRPPAHIVGMQLAPGAIDRAGNVYLAYPESLHDYPNYNGAAIKVVHANVSNLDRWSEPAVVAKPGLPGNVLPLIAAGGRGRVDVSWYHGRPVSGHKPNWYAHAAQSLNALSARPTWRGVRLSGVLAERHQTASDLMGACHQGAESTLNGFDCDRSTDVNGIALDRCGRLLLAWPAQAGLKTDGTYVSRQVGGPLLYNRPGCGH